MTGDSFSGGSSFLSRAVPHWHFAMMNDKARNQAFREAIEKAVRPGDLVLDIGTGAGLTALIAARAGGRVITCETNPYTAVLAKRVIDANGYGERITVVPASSSTLAVGRELPRRADVLIAEVFDSGFLGEGALPALEHARQELVTPDVRLVPSGGRLLAQIVESRALYELNNVGDVDGFDLSPFNLARSREYFAESVANYVHTPLTEAFPLFDFAFSRPSLPCAQDIAVPVVATGTAYAVVMWFELDLGGGIGVTNGPTGVSHWRQAVQTFDNPPTVASGGTLFVRAEHDLRRLAVGLVPGFE
ncbi:50S ribosomal protein L11 methyltransferase [Streptomyces sp. MS2.AVA.5]|uniref:50S ribosomal protein L11 methyltransferase n=1 Tax=Streptomyces achmelvichensis TaxID=3134111 RepID=A0ACC6PM40_9ACTN